MWVCPAVLEQPHGTAGRVGLYDPEVRHICQLVTVSGREEPRCHVARNVTWLLTQALAARVEVNSNKLALWTKV